MISNISSCDGWVDFSLMVLVSDNLVWFGMVWVNRFNSSGRISKNIVYWWLVVMMVRYCWYRMVN